MGIIIIIIIIYLLKIAPCISLGMVISARPASTRPGLTLMSQVLPGSIKNRSGMGFKKNPKRVWVGFGFYKKSGSKPGPGLVILKLLKTPIYIYIYIAINYP